MEEPENKANRIVRKKMGKAGRGNDKERNNNKWKDDNARMLREMR